MNGMNTNGQMCRLQFKVLPCRLFLKDGVLNNRLSLFIIIPLMSIQIQLEALHLFIYKAEYKYLFVSPNPTLIKSGVGKKNIFSLLEKRN